MLIGEIIQRVQAIYSKGVPSDDSRLSSRLIYNKLLSVRARLVSQEAKKKQRISQWNYQTIPCIELIKVEAHDCPCIEPVGCKILRSKYKLPKPLMGMSGELIKNVTSIDRGLKIDEIYINAVNSQKGNKYTSQKINYFIFNEYIYLVSPSGLKMGAISLMGLFENPVEVLKFPSFCNECIDCASCLDYYIQEFPLESSLVDAMIEITNAELIQNFAQAIEDTTNNTRDTLKEQSK